MLIPEWTIWFIWSDFLLLNEKTEIWFVPRLIWLFIFQRPREFTLAALSLNFKCKFMKSNWESSIYFLLYHLWKANISIVFPQAKPQGIRVCNSGANPLVLLLITLHKSLLLLLFFTFPNSSVLLLPWYNSAFWCAGFPFAPQKSMCEPDLLFE